MVRRGFAFSAIQRTEARRIAAFGNVLAMMALLLNADERPEFRRR